MPHSWSRSSTFRRDSGKQTYVITRHHREANKEKYGIDLKVPETWDEYAKQVEFFTRDTDNDGESQSAFTGKMEIASVPSGGLNGVWGWVKPNIIHMTHDQVEAMTMGQRICIMNQGRIVQTSPPMEVYRNPADTFVAGFLASPPMNLLPARVDAVDGGMKVVAGPLRLPIADHDSKGYASHAGRSVIFGIRPEDFSIEASPGTATIAVEVVAIEALGPEVILICTLPESDLPEVAAA